MKNLTEVLLLSTIAGVPAVTYYVALLNDVATLSAVPLSILAVSSILLPILWTMRTGGTGAHVGLGYTSVVASAAFAITAGHNATMYGVDIATAESVAFVGAPCTIILGLTAFGVWSIATERLVSYGKTFAFLGVIPLSVAASMHFGVQGILMKSTFFMLFGMAAPFLMYITGFRWVAQGVQSTEPAAGAPVPTPVPRKPAE